MSSFITAGPTVRRLLYSAGRRASELQRQRGYAQVIQPRKRTKPSSQKPPISQSPRSQRRQQPGALSADSSSRSEPRQIFQESDVPKEEEWELALTAFGNKDLTAHLCRTAALVYVNLATQHEEQWRNTLESEYKLSPNLIHWLGIVAVSVQQEKPWLLGVHMLRTASELGHDPSTLTLVRLLWQLTVQGNQTKSAGIQGSTMYRTAKARFDILLRDSQNPDALSLQGLMLAKQGDHDGALHHFRLASKVCASSQGAGAFEPLSASSPPPQLEKSKDGDLLVLPEPREPRWEWEISCTLGEADILKARGHRKQAKRLYRVAALELDDRRAFWELANLTEGPRDSPERRTYLTKAAISGAVDACQELGAVEEMRAQETGITEREKEFRLLLSKEWLRLASGEDLKLVRKKHLAEKAVGDAA